MLASLKNRDPKTILPLGMLISNFGNGMYILALSLLLYNSESGVSKFVALIIAQTVATLIMQVFASTAADDGFAQKIAVNAELIRAVIVFTGALLAVFGYHSALIAIGFLFSLIQPFYRTAIFKFGPLIARDHDLARYNAKVATFQQIGLFSGAASAGTLMLISPTLPLWINGITYLISALSVYASRIPAQSDSGYFLAWLKTIFNLKNAYLKWAEMGTAIKAFPYIMILAFVGTIDMAIINFVNTAYPVLLKNVGLSPQWVSYWDAIFAVGAIIGANIYGRFKRLHLMSIIPLIFMSLEAILLAAFMFPSRFIILSCMFILGIANSISGASISYQIQTEIPSEYIGRIAGIRQLFFTIISIGIFPWISQGLNQSAFAGGNRMFIFICTGLGIFISTIIVRHIFRKRS